MKRLTIIACLLTVLTAQAQEHKGARRLHKAFVEFVYKYKQPPHPTSTITNKHGAGGLLPPDKQNIVKTSKSSAWGGTQYLMSWEFSFMIGTDKPQKPFPLADLQKAFDKESGHCTSCYNYFIADGTGLPIFPGLQVTWGPEGNETEKIAFEKGYNVRVMTFVDPDGFRSTFLLMWKLEGAPAIYALTGGLAWFFSPATPAQVVPWTNENDETLNNSQPATIAATGQPIVTVDNEVQLNDLNIGYGRHVAFKTLLAKVERMQSLLADCGNDNERMAIAYTLQKVCQEYTALLSPWQYEDLKAHIDDIMAKLPAESDRALATAAKQSLKAKLNRTPNMSSLRDEDQAYLNAKGFHLLRHDVCHDHVTYEGQYYAGDEQVKYLDTYDSECEQKYHAEKTETGLQPGIYRLKVATRAAGKGAFIYALGDHDQKYLAEIPAYYTEGGNIFAEAVKRIHDLTEAGRQSEISGYDRRIANANNGKGFGWNRVVIDNIVVRDGTVKYGVSTLPEFTGKDLRATWFSACDFELERTGDLKSGNY